jgi:hypothetical protein
MSTYNGFWDITTSNYIFTYKSETPQATHSITIPPGIYTVSTINAAIQQGMLAVGKSQIDVNNFSLAIYTLNIGTSSKSPFSFNFTVADSINTVLGFDPLV